MNSHQELFLRAIMKGDGYLPAVVQRSLAQRTNLTSTLACGRVHIDTRAFGELLTKASAPLLRALKGHSATAEFDYYTLAKLVTRTHDPASQDKVLALFGDLVQLNALCNEDASIVTVVSDRKKTLPLATELRHLHAKFVSMNLDLRREQLFRVCGPLDVATATALLWRYRDDAQLLNHLRVFLPASNDHLLASIAPKDVVSDQEALDVLKQITMKQGWIMELLRQGTHEPEVTISRTGRFELALNGRPHLMANLVAFYAENPSENREILGEALARSANLTDESLQFALLDATSRGHRGTSWNPVTVELTRNPWTTPAVLEAIAHQGVTSSLHNWVDPLLEKRYAHCETSATLPIVELCDPAQLEYVITRAIENRRPLTSAGPCRADLLELARNTHLSREQALAVQRALQDTLVVQIFSAPNVSAALAARCQLRARSATLRARRTSRREHCTRRDSLYAPLRPAKLRARTHALGCGLFGSPIHRATRRKRRPVGDLYGTPHHGHGRNHGY